tara:strand:+ start:3240 stop:4496 length:1257 start_codon:yes stop_codon:yes gene_type:complete
MSGGLLEKAKQVSGDSDDDVGAAADAVIETKTVPNPSQNPIMLYAAGGSLAVCMALLYFMYLLPVYSGVIIFLMLIGSGYTASLHVRNTRNNGDALNGMQWTSIAVVYLLLAGVPYIAAMDLGGSVLLNYDSETWFDEDDDTVTLDLRQSTGLLGSEFSGGDLTVTVSQDGSETWSGQVNVVMNEEFGGNVGSVTLAISDFYSMNAQRVKSVSGSGSPVLEDHPYTVCIDVEGTTDCVNLPTAELTRTVTDVDEKATGHSSDQDCTGGHESCIDYVEFQGWVGEGTPSTDVLTVPARIQGTYQIDMEFVYSDGTKTIDYATITVDNNVGSWNDDTCGPGTMDIGVTYTEFFFECEDNTQFESDDALSEGYGCYTLTVTSSQDGVEMASSSSHYEFEEKQESNNDGSYSWEEFNAVNSC